MRLLVCPSGSSSSHRLRAGPRLLVLLLLRWMFLLLLGRRLSPLLTPATHWRTSGMSSTTHPHPQAPHLHLPLHPTNTRPQQPLLPTCHPGLPPTPLPSIWASTTSTSTSTSISTSTNTNLTTSTSTSLWRMALCPSR